LGKDRHAIINSPREYGGPADQMRYTIEKRARKRQNI
jgi:hypothetical protein